jgi:predicted transcriptional regulator|tara:strand:- start:15 stop:251 length:237 start_codon:yes stop_codon:yes gene_type:complete
MSKLAAQKNEILLEVHKLRKRQEIAELSNIHLNTLTLILNGKREPHFTTMVRIEEAVNILKAHKKETYNARFNLFKKR